MCAMFQNRSGVNIRSAVSILFIGVGILFFGLAAINRWGNRQSGKEHPSNKVTSAFEMKVDLRRVTLQPVTADSLDLNGVDVLSLVFLPVNYNCGVCSQRVAAFVKSMEKRVAFTDLSAKTIAVVIEPDTRTATHYGRLQQFGIPVFQLPEYPPSIRSSPVESCFALMVDPRTESSFLKVQLTKAQMTEISDAVFEAVRNTIRGRSTKSSFPFP